MLRCQLLAAACCEVRPAATCIGILHGVPLDWHLTVIWLLQGHGWEAVHVRQALQGLIDKHAQMPKSQIFKVKPLSCFTRCRLLPQGHGWEAGRVRLVLQGLIDKHGDVPKPPPFVYDGPLVGPGAAKLLKAWQDSESAKACIAPDNWRPPPPAGFLDAAGMRRVDDEAWRPVRTDFFIPMEFKRASSLPVDRASFLDAAGMRRVDEKACRPMRSDSFNHCAAIKFVTPRCAGFLGAAGMCCTQEESWRPVRSDSQRMYSRARTIARLRNSPIEEPTGAGRYRDAAASLGDFVANSSASSAGF